MRKFGTLTARCSKLRHLIAVVFSAVVNLLRRGITADRAVGYVVIPGWSERFPFEFFQSCWGDAAVYSWNNAIVARCR